MFCEFDDLFESGSLPPFVSVTTCPLGSAIPCETTAAMDQLVHGAIERNAPSLSIRSLSRFHESDPERWLRRLRALRPVRDVVERVDSRLGPGAESRIGVHVRTWRSSIVPETVMRAPVSAFLERMKKEDSGTRFVVATDDDEVQQFLKRELPGRCLFPARLRESRSREGMKEALVDLLGLSRCHRIWGTYWSSFTATAADYGGAELEIVHDSEPMPADPGRE